MKRMGKEILGERNCTSKVQKCEEPSYIVNY